MEIYKYKLFQQWAKSESLNDKVLKDAISEIEQGLYEANLGNGLYKKRIAMPGKGKRGSYRTLLAFKKKERTIFIYGFAKNILDNITEKEKKIFKQLAKDFLDMSTDEIQTMLNNKKLFRVK